jgi:amidophosphoribosyltransferase
MCLFEYVYFARPDATVDGVSIYAVRKTLGGKLAEEHPLDPTDAIVVPVPDSGVPSAIGFAEASGIPFQMGLIRSHYVGRTFIEPQETIRDFGVRLKLHPNRPVLAGKRVVVVDDSIVRGTTSRKLVKMIREAGAREVHFRVASPPTKWPCFYGIATPTREELIANTHDERALAEYLAADSVGYLSLGALVDAVRGEVGGPSASGPVTPRGGSEGAESGRLRGYCHACFSGEYPIPIPRSGDRAKLLTTIR